MPKYWVTLDVEVDASTEDEATLLVEDAVRAKPFCIDIIDTRAELAY